MIFCDQLTTNAYTYQNWEIMNYIVYGACIKSSMILPVPSFPIVKSTTWSSFSNLCSKLNKINYIYLNQKFEFSLITIKFFRTTFIQLLNAETFGKEEIEKILKLLLQYNIATYQELENILNTGDYSILLHVLEFVEDNRMGNICLRYENFFKFKSYSKNKSFDSYTPFTSKSKWENIR